MVQMDRVPKEHRKSMEAIRKQIHTKPPPPRVARQKNGWKETFTTPGYEIARIKISKYK